MAGPDDPEGGPDVSITMESPLRRQSWAIDRPPATPGGDDSGHPLHLACKLARASLGIMDAWECVRMAYPPVSTRNSAHGYYAWTH